MLIMAKKQEEYYSWGTPCFDELPQWPKAVLDRLTTDSRVKVCATYRLDNRIGFEIDFVAEIPQRPVVDIRRPERLVITVGESRQMQPEVLCLRKSFPTTPHTNLRPADQPTSLCLFEEPFGDISHDFTPSQLIGRIFNWLNSAAVDELHLPDQPLEPFIFSDGTIMIGRGAFQANTLIECFRVDDNGNTIIARSATEESKKGKKDILFFPIIVETPHHGVLIRHPPPNFDDLCDLLKVVNIDLKKKFFDYVSQYQQSYRESKVIIGLQVPKKRTDEGEVESTDYFAFLIGETLFEIGKKLDILTNVTGNWQAAARLDSDTTPIPTLADVKVVPWTVRFHLSKEVARKISCLSGKVDPSLLLVGAGALGSQVALILGRQGFGKWTICDTDRIFPHNLSRHAMLSQYTGWEKAPAIAHAINSVFDGDGEAQSIEGMFLGQQIDGQEDIGIKCDVLIDFSASDSVLNHLAHSPFEKPCLSGFVNPTAEAGVLLYEGQKRRIQLDDLYQQFFAEIASNPVFDRYFATGDRIIAYAGSCRDRSFQIAGDLISLQAAAMSVFIRSHIQNASPSIHVWMWNPTSMTLQHKSIKTHPVKVFVSNGWTIRISQRVLSQIENSRIQHNPKETGGVLLGKFDLNNKKIYVSSIFPAPEDSIMTEGSFIRGNNGLCEKINKINANVKAINYVGEWHTHPVGNSSCPSRQDKKTLNILQSIMNKDLFPALIVIKGDASEVYVDVKE